MADLAMAAHMVVVDMAAITDLMAAAMGQASMECRAWAWAHTAGVTVGMAAVMGAGMVEPMGPGWVAWGDTGTLLAWGGWALYPMAKVCNMFSHNKQIACVYSFDFHQGCKGCNASWHANRNM